MFRNRRDLLAPLRSTRCGLRLWKFTIPVVSNNNKREGVPYVAKTCDGKLMIAGGEGNGQAYRNVDLFDGSSWTKLDNLNIARHGSGLAVDCQCNQIHIASGSGAQGGSPELRSVETYFQGGEDVACEA